MKNYLKLPVKVDVEGIKEFIENIEKNKSKIDGAIKESSLRKSISDYLMIREMEENLKNILFNFRQEICKKLSKKIKKGKNVHYRGYTIFKGYQGGIYFRKSHNGR